jgi:large subunit ribosomal protein L9
MKVILLEKVGRRGRLGDQVVVKKGFARNYLFPQGKAVPATADNLVQFEERRAELEAEVVKNIEAAEVRKQSIEAIQVTISMKAGDQGKLFGSVGAQDLVAAAAAQDIEILRSEVRLPEGPIRNVGEYQVEIHVYEDVNAFLPVFVVADR